MAEEVDISKMSASAFAEWIRGKEGIQKVVKKFSSETKKTYVSIRTASRIPWVADAVKKASCDIEWFHG